MKSKVLVLGHWKTGTTLLCNILKWNFNKEMDYNLLTQKLHDLKYEENLFKKYITRFGEETVKFHTLNKCDTENKYLFLISLIEDCFEVTDCVTIPGINTSEKFADRFNLGVNSKILFTIRDYKSLYQKLKNMNINSKEWGAGFVDDLTHVVANYILMFLNFIPKKVEIIRLEDYDENNYKKQMDKIDKFLWPKKLLMNTNLYKQNHLGKGIIGHESSGDKYLKEKELYRKDIDTKLPDYIDKIFYKYYKISEYPYSERLNMISMDELSNDKQQVKDYIRWLAEENLMTHVKEIL